MSEKDLQVYRRINQMIVGERAFTHPAALIIGTNGHRYIETDAIFSANEEDERTLDIRRTGLGYGEYELALPPNTIYTAETNPLEEVSHGRISISRCPLGWKTTRREYLELIMSQDDFSIERYDEEERNLQEATRALIDSNFFPVDPEMEIEYSFEMPVGTLKSRFPKTYEYRKDLDIFLKTGQFSRIKDSIKVINDYGKNCNEQLQNWQVSLLEKIVKQTSPDWVQ